MLAQTPPLGKGNESENSQPQGSAGLAIAAQVPRCLRLHPDAPRPQRGLAAQPTRAAPFLALTHFLASVDEATKCFEIFDALTLQELESWFPDQSGILSQLPPTWTVQHAADLVGCIPLHLCWPQLSQSASVPACAAAAGAALARMAQRFPAKARHAKPAGTSG